MNDNEEANWHKSQMETNLAAVARSSDSNPFIISYF